MLRKAGQTAGPNRLTFFVDTHGGLEADIGPQNYNFF